MPVSSSETANPSGVLRAISAAPMFEVMITIAWRKSTVRPCASVRRPSSRICSRMLTTSGWLPPLVVPDVAGRGADQPRDGVLLHVLGHVDAHHRVLVAEQELGERARQLGLAHARGAQENERPGRPLGVL